MQDASIYSLDTPAVLVDRQRLEENLRVMQQIAHHAGVRLRPHIKTHKCLEIARLQLAHGASGLTCAKISEAEIMSAVCDDLFIAFPIIGEEKLARLDRLSLRARTRISVESQEGARQLHDHLQRVGRSQEVMVKIETGLKRTGVEIEDLEAFLTFLSRMPALHVVGLFTHEGGASKLSGEQEISAMLSQIAGILGRASEIFVRVYDRAPVISPGCTLTARVVSGAHGFTEIRPGTYALCDGACVQSGMYQPEECALSVLVRVVSVKKDGRVVVDGGSKTFAMDRHPKIGHGFAPAHPGLYFDRLSEEHGILQTSEPEKYTVGDLIEIVPSHVCPVVNLHAWLHVREGEKIVDRWAVDARGCVG
jgi:D-serine deaminase-like pyridoxal phosphate-dependent protein